MEQTHNITIIEGPTPTFEIFSDHWANSISEGPYFDDVALTQLRTFNGPELVERCYRSWQNRKSIHLEYKTSDGMERSALIVGTRAIETIDGHLLLLWVRIPESDLLSLDIDEPDSLV